MIPESMIISTSIHTILFIVILGILITRLFEKNIKYRLETTYLAILSFFWIVFRTVNAYIILSNTFTIVAMIIMLVSLLFMSIGACVVILRLSNVINKFIMTIGTLSITIVIILGIISVKNTSLDYYYLMLISSSIFTVFAYFGIIDFLIKSHKDTSKKNSKNKKYIIVLLFMSLIMISISSTVSSTEHDTSNPNGNLAIKYDSDIVILGSTRLKIISFFDSMRSWNIDENILLGEIFQ